MNAREPVAPANSAPRIDHFVARDLLFALVIQVTLAGVITLLFGWPLHERWQVAVACTCVIVSYAVYAAAFVGHRGKPSGEAMRRVFKRLTSFGMVGFVFSLLVLPWVLPALGVTDRQLEVSLIECLNDGAVSVACMALSTSCLMLLGARMRVRGKVVATRDPSPSAKDDH